MDLLNSTLKETVKAIKSRQVSATEVTAFFLKRIEKFNSELNAYTALNPEALKQAEAIDQRIKNGEPVGVLAGIPFGIKDLLCTKGLPTTASSKMLKDFVPPYDATVVSRLKAAGSVVLGKLNLDEFAMGSSNETSYFGVCKNPWNTDHVPGGSSGGSAASQASRMSMGTIGTDTGGSIRQPASFCGVVGVKPTYGRISRFGIVAYASSLDQAGPMMSNVEDAALALEVLCGRDPNDSTTSDRVVPHFSENLNANLKGKKIGYIKEHLAGIDHPDILGVTQLAFEELKKLGAELIEVSIPLTSYAVPMYYLISASEASSNLARYDGVKYGYRSEFSDLSQLSLDDFYSRNRGEGFGKEVKKRIMLGTYCLSAGYADAYYTKACKVRRLMQEQFQIAFNQCDAIVGPVTTTPAFKIGEKAQDPFKMYLNDIFTTSTNLAGLPGMSLPFGLSKDRLPIGIQITGNHFQEQDMLDVAFALEQTAPSISFKKEKPVIYV